MHFGALKLYIRGTSSKEQKISRINEYISDGGDIRYDDGYGSILFWAIYSKCKIVVLEHILSLYDKLEFNEGTKEFEIFNGVFSSEKYTSILAPELERKLKLLKLSDRLGISTLSIIPEGPGDCVLEVDDIDDALSLSSQLSGRLSADEFDI